MPDEKLKSLPIEHLVGAPLIAAVRASAHAAKETANLVEHLGSLPDLDFSFSRPREVPRENGHRPEARHPVIENETVNVSIPLLGAVSVPNLQVDTVNVRFTLEMRGFESSSSTLDRSEGDGGNVPTLTARPTAHAEQTRGSDRMAKYSFEIKATNHGTSETLARVMDLLAQSVAARPQASAPSGYDILRDVVLLNPAQIDAFESAGLTRDGLEGLLWGKRPAWVKWRDTMVVAALKSARDVRTNTANAILRMLDKARQERGG